MAHQEPGKTDRDRQSAARHEARLRGILKQDVEVMRASQNQGQRHAHHAPPPPASSPAEKTKPKRHTIKFDELNIVDTFHPANKDYGNMKIDEPKTPYNRDIPPSPTSIDADQLLTKLTMLAKGRNDLEKPIPVDEAAPETAGFRDARRQHYKEFSSVKEAKQLIEKEFEQEEHPEDEHKKK